MIDTIVLAMQQQAIIRPESSGGVPVWLYLLIVFGPGVIAVALTVTATVAWRLVWRDEHPYSPPTPKHVIKWALILGAVIGPACQLGFQRVASDITGTPLYWELVFVAPFITGLASMGMYEALKILFHRWGWKRAYELIRVRHKYADGRPERSDTTVMLDDTDTTEPWR